MRVLLVEDHADLAETVATGLRREGMAVDVALDGRDAFAHIAVTDYDVLVLDRDLPDVRGDEICRSLAAEGREGGILMLTAAGSIEDRVDGLSIGADDYLPKPFAFAELVARIRALGRRSTPPLPPALVRGDLRLDPAHRVATRAGTRLALSPKEFALLEYLLGASGRVVSDRGAARTRVGRERGPLHDDGQGDDHVGCGPKLGDPPVIETVPHGGYRI